MVGISAKRLTAAPLVRAAACFLVIPVWPRTGVPAYRSCMQTQQGAGPVVVQVLQTPDCPLAGQVRATIGSCLAEAGVLVRVEKVEGLFPSPTVLIGGADVVTGSPPGSEPSCRLDLPTRAQILAAIRRGASSAS